MLELAADAIRMLVPAPRESDIEGVMSCQTTDAGWYSVALFKEAISDCRSSGMQAYRSLRITVDCRRNREAIAKDGNGCGARPKRVGLDLG